MHLNSHCSSNIVNVVKLFIGMVKVVALFRFVVGLAGLEIMLPSTLNIVYIDSRSKSNSHIKVPSPPAIIDFVF